MRHNFGGGPTQPTKSIIISSANAPIGRKEWSKMKRQARQERQEAIPDTPGYAKKVAKERKATLALARQKQTISGGSKESPTI
ncbi:MAG: hypothetical protein WCL18_05405 [bacterium]